MGFFLGLSDSLRAFKKAGSRRKELFGELFVVWQLNAASKAREVVVFCPYWIVNKTNTTLRIRDVSPYSSATSIASPMADDGTAKPVLFR